VEYEKIADPKSNLVDFNSLMHFTSIFLPYPLHAPKINSLSPLLYFFPPFLSVFFLSLSFRLYLVFRKFGERKVEGKKHEGKKEFFSLGLRKKYKNLDKKFEC